MFFLRISYYLRKFIRMNNCFSFTKNTVIYPKKSTFKPISPTRSCKPVQSPLNQAWKRFLFFFLDRTISHYREHEYPPTLRLMGIKPLALQVSSQDVGQRRDNNASNQYWPVTVFIVIVRISYLIFSRPKSYFMLSRVKSQKCSDWQCKMANNKAGRPIYFTRTRWQRFYNNSPWLMAKADQRSSWRIQGETTWITVTGNFWSKHCFRAGMRCHHYSSSNETHNTTDALGYISGCGPVYVNTRCRDSNRTSICDQISPPGTCVHRSQELLEGREKLQVT